MQWVELSVAADTEAIESVAAFLSNYGQIAVEELRATPVSGSQFAPKITIRCYMTAEESEKHRQAIEDGLWHLSRLLDIHEPQYKTMTENDWMNAWKEHYQILHVGKRIVIVPTWKEYSPTAEEVVVNVDPGMAFGTGLHPSTQLCLKALEEYLQPGADVLDVGTGTGILAIAASKLGAKQILAIDNDPAAVTAARQNAVANGVAKNIIVDLASVIPTEPRAGQTIPVIPIKQYDLLLVNILADVIVSMTPALVEFTKPGGLIITAGIIKEREHLVLDAFASLAELVLRQQDGDWVSIVYRTHQETA